VYFDDDDNDDNAVTVYLVTSSASRLVVVRRRSLQFVRGREVAGLLLARFASFLVSLLFSFIICPYPPIDNV